MGLITWLLQDIRRTDRCECIYIAAYITGQKAGVRSYLFRVVPFHVNLVHSDIYTPRRVFEGGS